MSDEIQNQKKFNQILDTRCNRFENKYKESLKDNDRLSQQLELAAKTLVHFTQLFMTSHKLSIILLICTLKDF